jgi:hypothetical protein
VPTETGEWPWAYFEDCWSQFLAVDGFGIRATERWVTFPRGEADGVYTGFECRRRGKKELTRSIHKDYKDTSKLLIYNTTNSKIAIVCEDPISAMKVCLAGYAGVSLCGTHVAPDDAFKIAMLYDQIIVWLDNDKQDIVSKAIDNYNRFKLYNSKVTINSSDKDPKKYSLPYIQERVLMYTKEHNE